MTERYDVLVAGGGLVGLATAAGLASTPETASLWVAVVDPGPAPPARDREEPFDPRVVAVTEASRRRLRQAGIWTPAVEARSCAYTRMTVRDGEGTGAIEFDAADVHRPDLGCIVENRVLVEAAIARLEDCPSVHRLRGSIEGLESGGADREVRLRLAGGETLSTSLLVAADGGNSLVREQCGFQVRAEDYGHSAIVATIRTGADHGHTARQWFRPRGPLAFLPLAGKDGDQRHCSIVWSLDHDASRDLMALDDDAFRAALTRASEGALGPVEWVGRRYSFPLRRRHAPEYVQPGVALVGDAAHTIHPLAGQGVNLGFADAAVLVEEIARGRKRGLPPGEMSTLRRYQRRRKPENLAMLAAMEGFKRLFASEDPVLTVLRNRGLSAVDRLPPLKHQFVRRAMGL